MKRKLLVLAVLVGICVFNLADRPPSAAASSYSIPPGRSEACVPPPSAASTGFSPAATPAVFEPSGPIASSPALTFPLCSSTYCPSHQNSVCTCPPGTVRAGQPAPCDTWRPDCNAL